MTHHDLKSYRNLFPAEWQRQTFDAFVLPLEDLGLTDEEKSAFIRKAKAAVDRVIWFTYDTTRETFLKEADCLLTISGLSAEEKAEIRRKMYVRFMEGRIRAFQAIEKAENCPIPPIPAGQQDFHNTELAAVFAHLPDQPETSRLLTSLNVSWTYDQLHMVTWFSGQLSLGSGKYSRSRPNHSAKTTYERLLNPFSLLWIAAALGESMTLIGKVRLDIDDYASWRAKCGVIRRAIPWKRIYELAKPLVEKERKIAG